MSFSTDRREQDGTNSVPPDEVSPGLMAPAYRTLTVGTLALASLVAFEYLAVTTAMPSVARALDGLSLYALAFGGSLAAGVVGMVAGGIWSDARGPALSVWHGVGWFVTGLVISGFAPAMSVLVVGRIVQGFGGGLLSVALYVVVGRCYPRELHPRIFGAFAGAWVVPSIVGPALTGVVVTTIGWRWVFLAIPFLAVPAALLVHPALGRMVVEPDGAGRVLSGTTRRILWALGAASSACLLHYGGQQRGLVALLLLAIGLVGVVFFAPKLLPGGTFAARRGLPAVIALRGIASAAFFQAEIFVPLLLSRERGLSPAMAGLVLTIGALTWSTGSWYQGRDGQPFATTRLLQIGMGLLASGIATVALVVVPSVPTQIALVGWGVAGLGMGVVFPTLSVLTLELSLPGEQGANSSALQLCDSLFAAAVLALGGSLFAALVLEAPTTAYVVSFSIAVALGLVGILWAPRVKLREAPSMSP